MLHFFSLPPTRLHTLSPSSVCPCQPASSLLLFLVLFLLLECRCWSRHLIQASSHRPSLPLSLLCHLLQHPLRKSLALCLSQSSRVWLSCAVQRPVQESRRLWHILVSWQHPAARGSTAGGGLAPSSARCCKHASKKVLRVRRRWCPRRPPALCQDWRPHLQGRRQGAACLVDKVLICTALGHSPSQP